LQGGSGTYAFLVGIAWWEGGGLEVEQFFMRDYSEERSLLFALAGAVRRAPGAGHIQWQILRLVLA
jgi:hypothetical protein